MDHEQQINELYTVVSKLINELESQKKIITELRQENNFLIQQLEKYQTQKNSSNSSKPPSSDFPKIQKAQSLHTPSGKKPGAQPGHESTTLKMADIPDVVQKHSPNYCTCCGEDLSHITRPVLLVAVRLLIFRQLSQLLPNTVCLRCIASVGTTIGLLILMVFLPRSAMARVCNHWFPT
ncbi:MAG: DUF6444 domain-containing protein [Prolixibacteraceae bacterium]